MVFRDLRQVEETIGGRRTWAGHRKQQSADNMYVRTTLGVRRPQNSAAICDARSLGPFPPRGTRWRDCDNERGGPGLRGGGRAGTVACVSALGSRLEP